MDADGEITGEGWFLLDRVLGWVRDAGPFAIVDLHAAPGGQTGINHDDGPGYPLMFYVPRDRQLTVKLWQAIARRYAGNPAILGYDILNEPIAPYHDVATLNPRLEPFYKEVTTAIREVDPGRVVILAGGQWSSSFDMFGPPFADNLAYTYHLFWASTKRDSIQRHLNFSSRYDVPLFLGETGELTDEWNARFRKLNETHGIGWSFWTYKNLDTPSTVVSIPRPDGWNEIVAFADGKRTDQARRGADRPRDRRVSRRHPLQERRGAVELSGVAGVEGISVTPSPTSPLAREPADYDLTVRSGQEARCSRERAPSSKPAAISIMHWRSISRVSCEASLRTLSKSLRIFSARRSSVSLSFIGPPAQMKLPARPD